MSKIEVNTVDVQCGSTLTLGSSGKTVQLASGASQSGFGRTGTVDWQTSSIKTATFTAANGEGYFCNTTSGAFTVNLPAGSAGAIVAFSDYTRTFQTNNLTISPQSGEKIGGVAASTTLSTEGQTATFVYVDSTEGWINIQETSNSVTGRQFITATGGTITTSGDFKIHTFTSPGTFCVSAISNVAAENTVGYVVVAGGGGGSANGAGGGGAGGYREGRNVPVDNFTASPLVADAPTNAVTLTATGFPITVGAGGTGVGSSPYIGGSGANSIFSTITSAGGGGGGSRSSSPKNGVAGGSGGGGGGGCGPGSNPGGAGNTPPVTPSQGNAGGTANGPSGTHAGGGGGGATAVGGTAPGANCVSAGPGGAGATSSITGSPVARAGGGGGSGRTTPGSSPGGTGGTGGGGNGEGNPSSPGSAGTANTGGGGGGTEFLGNSGFNGGSGVVIIRYKYQ